MTTKKNLVKSMFINILTAGIFSFGFVFTACSDDPEIDKAPEVSETLLTNKTRASASTFNINQHTVIYGGNKQVATPFDTKDWQKEEAIFIYVGGEGDQNIYTEMGEKLSGFKLVNLPWCSTASSNNVPQKIWKEMTANSHENPWKLVLMNCGKENVPNGNFLGFYNELTGMMRIFVYVPKEVSSGGSTHMWGVLMSDQLASRSIFRYGVPEDKNITTDKAKKCLSQTNEMAQIVSPWKKGNFGFNDRPLESGWWAFDVDFSMYRNENTFTSLSDRDEVLSVQPLCRKDASLEMTSKLTATLKGSLDLETSQASTSSGIFTPLEEILGKANDVADLVEIAQSVIDPNPLKAIENGIKLAKGACNLVGIDYGAETTGFDGYKGTMNLNMDGTIDTKGVITNQENISGFSPISFKKSDFLTENCSTFGEGIWNLEQAPVVYHTNASIFWKYDSDGNNCVSLDKKSPFGGQMNYENNKKPHHGQVTYFDPSSVKLVLNPNVFTAEEIANAKVYATCGVRKGMQFGSTEIYREAMGLGKSQFKPCGYFEYCNRPLHEAPFDALSSHKNDMGMKTGTKFEANTFNGHQYGVVGRGDADYLVEPQALTDFRAPDMMPAYEVTVTVIVKKNDGKEVIYTRNYLPEYKEMKIELMPEVTDSYIQQSMPKNYVTEIYKQQMAHIKDIRNWTRRVLFPTSGTPCHMKAEIRYTKGADAWYVDKNETRVSLTESYATLFDNDLSNRWVSAYDNVFYVYKRLILKNDEFCSGRSVATGVWKNQPCWWVEFQSNFPISPRSYSLISANDAGKYPQCNPKCWILYGKKNQSDNWTILGMSSYNNQPEDMLPRANSKSTRELPFRFNKCENMQYFRLEIQNTDNTNHLIRLGEIRFNYND